MTARMACALNHGGGMDSRPPSGVVKYLPETIMELKDTELQGILTDKTLFVLDCRPKLNAYGNMAKGGGFEAPDAYNNIALAFLGIENIHAVRKSFERLKHQFTLFPPSSSQNSELINILRAGKACQWLTHLATVLKGARFCARIIYQHSIPVLVHCSDGWDRTSQVSALAQIILDPYYRTFNGFAVLIERDWIQAGHPK